MRWMYENVIADSMEDLKGKVEKLLADNGNGVKLLGGMQINTFKEENKNKVQFFQTYLISN